MEEKTTTITKQGITLNETRLPPLWLCLVMDVLGCISYLLPALGELSDLIWAPISAFIFYKMFGGRRGLIGSIFNLLEESFPWSDIVPTFTIMWLIEWQRRRKGSRISTPTSTNP